MSNNLTRITQGQRQITTHWYGAWQWVVLYVWKVTITFLPKCLLVSVYINLWMDPTCFANLGMKLSTYLFDHGINTWCIFHFGWCQHALGWYEPYPNPFWYPWWSKGDCRTCSLSNKMSNCRVLVLIQVADTQMRKGIKPFRYALEHSKRKTRLSCVMQSSLSSGWSVHENFHGIFSNQTMIEFNTDDHTICHTRRSNSKLHPALSVRILKPDLFW